jgi:hypothetical protein|tara:strand:- start:429 stop:845 length:417 start_codon:yes stop_codon:yes gene_type:complete
MNNSNLMNSDLQQIPQAEIQFFKERVSRWLNVDSQIDDLQKQIRDLKKVRDKELEPEITKFMTTYKVSDLNTDSGKLRCQEKKTKKGLNRENIRTNLSQYLTDQGQLDEAINKIWTEREIKISYKLQKLKPKKQTMNK